MLHKVVVPFPCSWDGIHAVDLNAGDVRDFGPMAGGLIGMGWIEPVTVEDAPPEFAVVATADVDVAEDGTRTVTSTEYAVNTPKRGRKRG